MTTVLDMLTDVANRYDAWRRNRESENAQAERELASLDTDTDPEPGAFYGRIEPDQTEQSHA